jgi:hypothetical protein
MKTKLNQILKMRTLVMAVVLFVTCSASTNALNKSTTSEKSIDGLTGSYYGLIVNVPANVILTQSETSGIKISGQESDIEKVNFEVKNGSLTIGGTNKVPVTIYISTEELNLIEVNGSAKVFAQSLINTDILLLKVNGMGSIRLDVRTLSLGMIVKGSGKIIVSGSTGDCYTKVTGSGKIINQNLDAYHFVSDNSVFKANAIAKDEPSRVSSQLLNQ